MSTLETNSIAKYSGNNVAIDDSLNLKSYTTTQRNALTSAAGDIIYNSTDSKVQVYNGSSWDDLGGIAAFQIQFVIVAGGGGGAGIWGSGNMGAGGAGAGGYISNVTGENTGGGLSATQTMYIAPSTNYTVSIGAGGVGTQSQNQESGYEGNPSYFNNITAEGGGAAQSYIEKMALGRSAKGGSGGGRGTYINRAGVSTEGGDGLTGQGYDGGSAQGALSGAYNNATGGGGGASAVGANAGSDNGGNGGAGVATSISGSSVTYAGGGGGSGAGTVGTGGAGGGADGVKNANGGNGTANTGGGAGGIYNTSGVTSDRYGGNGGSGIVVLRYPNTYTLSQSGLTTSNINTAIGGTTDKYTTITAGTGTVSFA